MSKLAWHEKLCVISGFSEDSRWLRMHPQPDPYRIPVYDNRQCTGYYEMSRDYFNKAMAPMVMDIISNQYPFRGIFAPKCEYHDVPLGIWINNGPIKWYPPRWMVDMFGTLVVRPILVFTITVDNICELFRQFIGLEYPPITKPSQTTLEESINKIRSNGWEWIDKENEPERYAQIQRARLYEEIRYMEQPYPCSTWNMSNNIWLRTPLGL